MNIFSSNRSALRAAGVGTFSIFVAFNLSACDTVIEAIQKVAKVPTAALSRVDMVESPTTNTLLSWSCYKYVSDSTCGLLGFSGAPSDDDLRFSFDVVFDLFNANEAFSIPLVEMLLGISVFETNNLGAVCVSFCDPDDPKCEPAQNAEGSCLASDDSSGVLESGDIIATVENLVDLASDIADGTVDDNWDYRMIPAYSEQSCQAAGVECTEEEVDGVTSMCCGDECTPLEKGCTVGTGSGGTTCALCEGYTEAHLQFDFGTDPMMGLFEGLLEDGLNDLLAGRQVELDVPYAMEGTLFFDVPEMGRYDFGFGPLEDTWPIR